MKKGFVCDLRLSLNKTATHEAMTIIHANLYLNPIEVTLSCLLYKNPQAMLGDFCIRGRLDGAFVVCRMA